MTSPRQARARRTLMTTSIADEKGNTPAAETAQTPKPAKKARTSARAAHVAPSKAKAAKKASPAKKAPKSQKKAVTARDGSKKAEILALLRQPKGATLTMPPPSKGADTRIVKNVVVL